MNDATPTAMAVPHVLPLAALRPSQTHVQAVRRARYNPDSLRELAESIRTSGILQPILVRPGPAVVHDGGATSTAEIIAGERRWRAAELAGLAEVPVTIRDLTDSQVLEAQLVENLQREDLDPLSEAEGYQELMTVADVDADAVAAKVGKSRSYVYSRTKLLDLIPAGREALASGKLDASRALLVARIRDEKHQATALDLALQLDWQGERLQFSYRDLLKEIGKKKATAELAAAPFPLDDATLGPGPCTTCEHRSGNCPVAGVKESADVCHDVRCFNGKTREQSDRRRRAAVAAGLPVISGPDAKKLVQVGDIAGYVDLDAVCDDDQCTEPEPQDDTDEAAIEAWETKCQQYQSRTYRAILGEDAKPTAVLVDPKNQRTIELMPVDQVRALLKKHGINLSPRIGRVTPPPIARHDPQKWEEQERARKARAEKVKAFRTALAQEIFKRATDPIGHADLVLLAEDLSDKWTCREFLPTLYGAKPVHATMKTEELGRYIRFALIAEEISPHDHEAAPRLYALAKRYKIDPEKFRKELEGGAPATKNAEAKKAAAKKSAKAKKASSKAAGKKKARA